jgi:hypothetical protein
LKTGPFFVFISKIIFFTSSSPDWGNEGIGIEDEMSMKRCLFLAIFEGSTDALAFAY